MNVDDLVGRYEAQKIRTVEVTGGEPLAQTACLELLTALCEIGDNVLLETSGSVSILGVDPRVHVIMDVKCPDSGMSELFCRDNLRLIGEYSHELKFVISSKRDFDWAAGFVRDQNLFNRNLLLSPVLGKVSASVAARWLMEGDINFRLQLQLHKLIWPGGGDER